MTENELKLKIEAATFRKILKHLDSTPKYKLPGIGIDIQGKQRDRYKIRIAGARKRNGAIFSWLRSQKLIWL